MTSDPRRTRGAVSPEAASVAAGNPGDEPGLTDSEREADRNAEARAALAEAGGAAPLSRVDRWKQELDAELVELDARIEQAVKDRENAAKVVRDLRTQREQTAGARARLNPRRYTRRTTEGDTQS